MRRAAVPTGQPVRPSAHPASLEPRDYGGTSPLLHGGNSGPAIVPGKPQESRLIRAVRQLDDELIMPPEGPKHSDRQIADLARWVEMGAPFPASAEVADKLRELQRELDSEHMRTQLVVALDPSSRIRSGSTAELWFDPERMHVFDPASGENLTRDPERTFDDDKAHAGVAMKEAAGDSG